MAQGHRQGGLRGLQPPPPTKKREEKEGRGMRKRNQKRKEVEPVIPRTCGPRLLAAPRSLTATRPLTVVASAFCASRRPPLLQNPANTPESDNQIVSTKLYQVEPAVCKKKYLDALILWTVQKKYWLIRIIKLLRPLRKSSTFVMDQLVHRTLN